MTSRSSRSSRGKRRRDEESDERESKNVESKRNRVGQFEKSTNQLARNLRVIHRQEAKEMHEFKQDPKRMALSRLSGAMSVFTPSTLSPILEMLDLNSLSAWIVAIRSMGRANTRMGAVVIDFLLDLMRKKVIHSYDVDDKKEILSSWFRRFVMNSVQTVRVLRMHRLNEFPMDLWQKLVHTSPKEVKVIDVIIDRNDAEGDEQETARVTQTLLPLADVTGVTHFRLELRPPVQDMKLVARVLGAERSLQDLQCLEFSSLGRMEMPQLPTGALESIVKNAPQLRILRLAQVVWNDQTLQSLSTLRHLRIVELTSTNDLPFAKVAIVDDIMRKCPKLICISFANIFDAAYRWHRLHQDTERLDIHETNDLPSDAWSFECRDRTLLGWFSNLSKQWEAIGRDLTVPNGVWGHIWLTVTVAREGLAEMFQLIRKRSIRHIQRLSMEQDYTEHGSWNDEKEPWATEDQVRDIYSIMSDRRSLCFSSGSGHLMSLDHDNGIAISRGVLWHTVRPWLKQANTNWKTVDFYGYDIHLHAEEALNFLMHEENHHHHHQSHLQMLRLIKSMRESRLWLLSDFVICESTKDLELLLIRNRSLRTMDLPGIFFQWSSTLLRLLVDSWALTRLVLNGIGGFPARFFNQIRNREHWAVTTVDPATDWKSDYPAPQMFSVSRGEGESKEIKGQTSRAPSDEWVIREQEITDFSRRNPDLEHFEWIAYPPQLTSLPQLFCKKLRALHLSFASMSISSQSIVRLRKACPELRNVRFDFPDPRPWNYIEDVTTYPVPTPGRVRLVLKEQVQFTNDMGGDEEDDDELMFSFTRRGAEMENYLPIRKWGSGWGYVLLDWPRPLELELVLPLPLLAQGPPLPVEAGIYIHASDLKPSETRKWVRHLRSEGKEKLPVAIVIPDRVLRDEIRFAIDMQNWTVLDFVNKTCLRLPPSKSDPLHEDDETGEVVEFPVPAGFKKIPYSDILPKRWYFSASGMAGDAPRLILVIYLHLQALNPDTPPRLIISHMLEMGGIPFRAYLNQVRSTVADQPLRRSERKRVTPVTKAGQRLDFFPLMSKSRELRRQPTVEEEIRQLSSWRRAKHSQIIKGIHDTGDWNDWLEKIMRKDSDHVVAAAVQREKQHLKKWLHDQVVQEQDQSENRALASIMASVQIGITYVSDINQTVDTIELSNNNKWMQKAQVDQWQKASIRGESLRITLSPKHSSRSKLKAVTTSYNIQTRRNELTLEFTDGSITRSLSRRLAKIVSRLVPSARIRTTQ